MRSWEREVALPFQEILEIFREGGGRWVCVWRTRKWFEREREVEGWREERVTEAVRGFFWSACSLYFFFSLFFFEVWSIVYHALEGRGFAGRGKLFCEHTLPPSLRILVRLLLVPQLQGVIEVDERGVGVVVGAPAVAAEACGAGVVGPASLPGPFVVVITESVLFERGLVGSVPESHVCIGTGGACVQTN